MSRIGRLAISFASLAALVGVASVGGGCSGAKQTELVAGVSTQVRVPRDIRTVRVDVTRNGAPFLCRAYRVYDGKVLLPRTLGTIPVGSTSDAITISITGFTAAESEPGYNAFTDECLVTPGVTKEKVDGGGARVLRRARLPYDPETIRFVPMPLRYSCFDKECDPNNTGEKTCKAGECVDAALDVSKLKTYVPGIDDGTGSACFSPKTCFPQNGIPPYVVDPDNCIYAVPGTLSAPGVTSADPNAGEGVNVRVVYDGGFTKEILDLDKEEGFFLPDPNLPQRFQLSPGLCRMVNNTPDTDGNLPAHRISAVQTFGFCQPKLITQPICAAEANAIMTGNEDGVASVTDGLATCLAREISPAPASLLILAEKSVAMKNFYGLADIGTKLNTQLQDPLFAKLETGFKFLRGTLTGCADTTHLPADVGFGPAKTTSPQIASLFTAAASDPALPAASDPLFYDLALKSTGTLQPLFGSTAPLKSLVILGNHGFGASCGGNLVNLANDIKNANISAHALVVGSQATADGAGAAAAFGSNAIDLTVANDASQAEIDMANSAALAAFGNIIAELTTCAYDPPSDVTVTDADKVLFYKNFPDTTESYPFDASCTTAGADDAPGTWGNDSNGKIALCHSACKTVRTAHAAEAQVALQQNRRAQAMPVAIQTGCGTTVP